MKKKIISMFLVLFGAIGLFVGCKKQETPDTKVETQTVTFYKDGDMKDVYTTVTVNKGEKVSKPAVDPSKEEDEEFSYTFKTWIDADTEEEYDFDTAVKKNYKLYADYDKDAKDYDLVVYVWQGTTDTTYISDAEVEALTSYVEEAASKASYRVLVSKFNNMTMNTFASEVNKVIDHVDVVIAGANINPKDESGKTIISAIAKSDAVIGEDPNTTPAPGRVAKVAEGWFNNTTRYCGVVNGAENAHAANALALYTALTNKGPYACSLDKEAVVLVLGETSTVNATATKAVTWKSLDENVVSVENGVLTPVAVGTTKVVATVGGVLEYEVSVTVVAERQPYIVNIYMSEAYKVNLSTIQGLYNEVKDELATVNFYFSTGSKAADVATGASEKDLEEGCKLNMVVGHNQVWSKQNLFTTGDYGSTYWAVKEAVDKTWNSTLNESNSYGITSITTGYALTECNKIATILKGVNNDLFTVATTANLTVGKTTQLEPVNGTVAVSGVTYTTKDETIATVSETGLITAIAEGNTTIVAKLGYKEIEVNVTVSAAPKDLLVYIAGHTSTKITLDEANAIIAAFTAEGKPGYGKTIFMDYSNLSDGDFATRAANADVVIGSGNISNIELSATEGKVSLGKGWTETSRYIAVTAACSEHAELATAFYTMFQENHPDYFTVDNETLSIKVGETAQITASTEVTYVSNDTTIATVSETGLVSAIKKGSTTITVTKGSKTVTISVDVAQEPYSIVIVLSSKYKTSVETLKTEYAKVKDSDCSITWVILDVYKAEDTATAVIAYDEEHSDAKVDVVVGHSQVWSANHLYGVVDGENYDMSYWASYNTAVDTSWGANTNKIGVTAEIAKNAAAVGEITKIATILAAAMPAA